MTDAARPSGALSEEERSAAFRQQEPEKGLPANVIWIGLAILAVLGLGGAIADHFLSEAGLNGASTTATTLAPGAQGQVVSPPSTPSTPQLNSTLAAFMGIQKTTPSPATGAELTDQAGRAISPATLHGDVVVLSFFDSACDDICPIVTAELAKAASSLGPEASHVVFLTVNTDPLALSVSERSRSVEVARADGLAALPTWHFASSGLSQLNAMWKAYGVSVSVEEIPGVVAHNDVMDFIDADGLLRYQATPFANESSNGAFTLPQSDVDRWGEGIAHYAKELLGGAP